MLSKEQSAVATGVADVHNGIISVERHLISHPPPFPFSDQPKTRKKQQYEDMLTTVTVHGAGTEHVPASFTQWFCLKQK